MHHACNLYERDPRYRPRSRTGVHVCEQSRKTMHEIHAFLATDFALLANRLAPIAISLLLPAFTACNQVRNLFTRLARLFDPWLTPLSHLQTPSIRSLTITLSLTLVTILTSIRHILCPLLCWLLLHLSCLFVVILLPSSLSLPSPLDRRWCTHSHSLDLLIVFFV